MVIRNTLNPGQESPMLIHCVDYMHNARNKGETTSAHERRGPRSSHALTTTDTLYTHPEATTADM